MSVINTREDQTQYRIDKILYLGSLASNRTLIDPYLEPLRKLTATKVSQGVALSEEDFKTLDAIELNLTNFLITKEPTRSFTPESLRQHVYERWEARKKVDNLRLQTTGILVLAALVFAAVLVSPYSSLEVRATAALTAAITVCYWGGAFFFMTALKYFSPAVRRIYRLIAIGLAIGSMTTLLNTALALIYHGETPWQTYWIINFGFYASYPILYLACRSLAKLQSARSLAENVWLVSISASVCAGALALTTPGRALDPFSGVTATGGWFSAAFLFAAAALVYKVWATSTESFRYPMLLLWLALLTAGVGWGLTTPLPFLPHELFPFASKVTTSILVVATILLVRSGYAFNKLSRY